MELDFPKRGELEPQFSRVTKWLRNDNGIPFGKAIDNYILDMSMYKVEYAKGNKFDLSSKRIAENMFAQIDEEVNHHMLMDEITNYMFDEAAVKSQDAFVTTFSGTNNRRQTTQWVSLCVKWRNGNTSWVNIKDTKEAYPVQLLEYAVEDNISMEPAFA